MKYAIVKEKGSTNFVAYAPDLPGRAVDSEELIAEYLTEAGNRHISI